MLSSHFQLHFLYSWSCFHSGDICDNECHIDCHKFTYDIHFGG